MTTKASSLLEKFITAGTIVIIALGVVFGTVALTQTRRSVNTKEAALALEKKARDEAAAGEKLMSLRREYSAAALNFLGTGQWKPYLDDMNTARNQFLSTLRDLRDGDKENTTKAHLDAIEQAEMDHALGMSKAIETRKKGTNPIGIAITLQTQVGPKAIVLDKALATYQTFKKAQFETPLAKLKAEAEHASSIARKTVSAAGVGALSLAVLILFVNMALLAKRHHREKKTLLSESRMRSALEKAKVIFWERNLVQDGYDKDPRHYKLYGFTKEPPLWNFETFLRAIVPADRDRVKATIVQALETAHEYTVEFQVKWPDKTDHRIFSKGQIHREAGKAVSITGFDTEIVIPAPIDEDDADARQTIRAKATPSASV